MRFLTAAILSISLAVAGQNADEQTAKTKQSRSRSFLRAVGSFGGSMVLTDPYQEVGTSKKAAKPELSTFQSVPANGTPQQPVEKSETPQPQK